MLPLHNPPTAAESLSKLVKSSPPAGKFLTRWILLGITIILVLWYGGPLVGDLIASEPRLDVRPGFGGEKSNNKATDENKVKDAPKLTDEEKELWEMRRDEVRDAFKHAWTGYWEQAYPHDELRAVSGSKSDSYNGWGVTLYDSLDTMWIMGMKDEFKAAVDGIRDRKFNATKPNHYAPFFETTIRYLGGALSAYALSGEEILRQKADELGALLLPSFDGTPSGLPAYSVNVATGKIEPDQGRNTVLFAEASSCQLEFKYLSKITGKKEYYERVQKAMNHFYRANVKDGLFHDNWFTKDGTPSGSHFTIGATADSGYEYLLKQWIQSGDLHAHDQYIKSVNGIINNLLYLTPKRGLMYVGDMSYGHFVHRLEHLSCFLPGTLALGAHLLDLAPEDKELHEWAAHALAYTCATTYADQTTGLGPDEMTMPVGVKWIDLVNEWKEGGRQGPPPGTAEPPPEKVAMNRDYTNNWSNAYLLRPETVESIFYMWRTTGDIKWRERGYAIFQAINKHTRTKYGFSSIHGVDSDRVNQLDDMPSWFLAETLKYLYLLFCENNVIKFDTWVFNTEAHPLPIFKWTEAERSKFGIPRDY